MNVIVFGATGTIGRRVVEQALGQGHTVTAFARRPDRLTLDHLELRRVQGDVLDPYAVRQAVKGQDAVIITLGAGGKGGLRAPGTRNVVDAMRHDGPRRLICQSTLGAGDSRGNLNFVWKFIMFGLLLRPAYIDHQKQEAIVRDSGLDWTIVRPGAFTDGPATTSYLHGFPATQKGLSLKISRADVADFVLRQLTDTAYLRQAPGLST